MSKYNAIGLYNHNIKSYEKIKKGFEKSNIVSIVHATGTGKSYNALQLAYDNPNQKIIYIVPFNSIIEHLSRIIENNPNIDKKNFLNLEFRTYQSFISLSDDEIADIDCDLLILDEFHHIGAPIWGAKINKLINTHTDIKVLGMTAYTVRDRGSSYERDMTAEDELFENSVVSNYDLCDAMIDGVLPKPIYKSGYLYLDKTIQSFEYMINKLDHNTKTYNDLNPLLNDMKKRVNEAPGVSDIFKKYVKKNGKYIYFCPPVSEIGRNDINTIIKEAKKWLNEMGLTDSDYELYSTTADMSELGKKNRNAFYNDVNLNGDSVNDKLRIMFAINQYNEGVHAPGLDGVIMGRDTKSDIIFFEQLGRALSVRCNANEEYEKYNKYSLAKLKKICDDKNIVLSQNVSKNECIEKILAPTIIDLAGNINFIKELENNLKDRIKDIESNETESKRIIHLGSAIFDIDVLNEDLFKIIEYMNDRLSMSWMDKYNLAKDYYEHYGDLDVPINFKTINGIDYDENGFKLGQWIFYNRRLFKNNVNRLSKEQIRLLDNIGMIWDIYNNNWQKKYNLAKAYYEKNQNLLVPGNFRTFNGYEYDENGEFLGSWIYNLRTRYLTKGKYKLTKEQIKSLEKIGMVWVVYEDIWNRNYNLAKEYFIHYGNLKVPRNFKTFNGYEYDENGIKLGIWVSSQRKLYNDNSKYKLTDERVQLLENIGIVWNILDDNWMTNYHLAKAYFDHFGNLRVPRNFRTYNGIDYDDNGLKLGSWVSSQRQTYNEKNESLSEEQIRLLEKIGMVWKVYKDSWNNNYNLAKEYFKYYGNLQIPLRFKTSNGIDYDENGVKLGSWLSNIKMAYVGKGTSHLDENQIKLLEEIGIIWRKDKDDDKFQKEKIDDSNITRKQIEIYNRVNSLLNNYDSNILPLKEQINEDMIENLNHKKR